jgi:hypothetical protein
MDPVLPRDTHDIYLREHWAEKPGTQPLPVSFGSYGKVSWNTKELLKAIDKVHQCVKMSPT